MTQKTLWGLTPSSHCSNCKKPLKDPTSVARGMGPVCWARLKPDLDLAGDWGQEEDHFLGGHPFTECGLVCLREDDWDTKVNVHQALVHHSPTGLEWGYGGSGPADLALNVVQLVLEDQGWNGPLVELYGDRPAFQMAWGLHQDFKWAFISGLPREGGQIPMKVMVDWVREEVDKGLANGLEGGWDGTWVPEEEGKVESC